jgi:hypothetical protein
MKFGNFSIYNRVGQHRTFGLIGFKAKFETKSPFLRIRADNFKKDFAFEELIDVRPDVPKDEIRFAILTQLLPNGPCDVIVEDIERLDAIDAKPVSARFSIVVDNRGPLANEVQRALKLTGLNPIFGPVIDSDSFPYGEQFGIAWFDAEPSPSVPLSFDPQPGEAAAIRHLQAHGFCLLPSVIPGELCDELNAQADQEINEGRIKYTWGTSQRLQGLHHLPAGRKIWTYPPVISFLRKWFRDEPVACQSLYYMFGSQQDAHQDTIHLTPYPSGYMCGVWVALQDIAPDSGELFVYPGSHRTPRLRASKLGLDKVFNDYKSYSKFDAEIRRMMNVGGYEKALYRPKKGQILVWHENLTHGGNRRDNLEAPRRSIVSHYFARGIVGYYDSRGEPAAEEEMPL